MNLNLTSHLAPERAELLDRLAEWAESRHAEAWLVGGVVRDALLEQLSGTGWTAPPDLDVTLTLDLLDYAQELQQVLDADRVVVEPALHTLALEVPGAGELDLVSARHEFYPDPPGLPAVVPTTSISLDLARRDFTVNTLALQLPLDDEPIPHCWATGMEDLAAGRLRLLHRDSFSDDPTRIARAAYYLARIGFQPAGDMLELARSAIASGVLDQLAGNRLKEPLLRIAGLAESAPELFGEAVEWAGRLGLTGALTGGATPDRSEATEIAESALELRGVLTDTDFTPEEAVLVALLEVLAEDAGELKRLAEWLELPSGWSGSVPADDSSAPESAGDWLTFFDRSGTKERFIRVLGWGLETEQLRRARLAYRRASDAVNGGEVADETGLSGPELGAEIERRRERVLERELESAGSSNPGRTAGTDGGS